MNPFGVDTSESNIRRPLISLKVLYDGMPSTTGCEQCEKHFGEDAFWCCRFNSPSLYYVEFLKALETIQKTWKKPAKRDLLLRAIVNYLDTRLVKGCIFWEGRCQIYEDRTLSCRIYGVVPQGSWDKRIKVLKDREGEDFSVRDQCDKVSASCTITEADEDKWFEHTRKCEEMVGVSKDCINLHDVPGGSYRTFHDHLILELLEPAALNNLTEVKLTQPSREDIEEFAEVLSGMLEAKL